MYHLRGMRRSSSLLRDPLSSWVILSQDMAPSLSKLLNWWHQITHQENIVSIVAGVDLGGTAVNYTLINEKEQFLIEGLCEYPSLSKQGPEICLKQIEDGLSIAAKRAVVNLEEIVAVGLDTPGPASASGVLSARGSTNFVHADWAGFDIRTRLEARLSRPVTYLNDGNAGALWGHFSLFGVKSRE